MSGLFEKSTSIVQALTPDAHRVYQTWHKEIDNNMVVWLNDHQNAKETCPKGCDGIIYDETELEILLKDYSD